jgi:hypothetical protein
MQIIDFETHCPLNAHLSHFNLKGHEQTVVSAKGYNLDEKGIPGTLSLVWNEHGEAYSRNMTAEPSTDFREMNRVITYDGQVYKRDTTYDIHFPKP